MHACSCRLTVAEEMKLLIAQFNVTSFVVALTISLHVVSEVAKGFQVKNKESFMAIF